MFAVRYGSYLEFICQRRCNKAVFQTLVSKLGKKKKTFSNLLPLCCVSQGLETGNTFLSRTGSGTSRALSVRAAPCRSWALASSQTAVRFCAQTATATTDCHRPHRQRPVTRRDSSTSCKKEKQQEKTSKPQHGTRTLRHFTLTGIQNFNKPKSS